MLLQKDRPIWAGIAMSVYVIVSLAVTWLWLATVALFDADRGKENSSCKATN